MYSRSSLMSLSVLSPQTWPFSLECLPQAAYLVGGTVRDALLERDAEYLDLDFVMPQGAVETAQAIARRYKAGFVLLDAERQIARVVFKQATADFAQQEGATLEKDLKRRDFTVNAIAYNPHTGELVDPLQGYVDLQHNLIRMVSPQNLREDPLRLLRAYRQAAQLNFDLEGETQLTICQLAPALGKIAAERVQSEFSYLLSTAKGTSWLTAAWQGGLLQHWFPHATAADLAQVAAIDQATVALEAQWPALGVELCKSIRESPKRKAEGAASVGGHRTWLSTAKLASLLAKDPEVAEAELWHLKYSRAEIRIVTTILKFLSQMQAAASLSCREQYFLFQGVGDVFPALAVFAVAKGTPIEAIAPLVSRFLTPDDPVAHPTPLLTGKDLMSALNLPAGPQIGQLLAAIQLARAEGKISSAAEGLQLAAQLVEPR